MFNDSIRNFLGFRETILYKENILLRNLVDILSFDIFLECDITQNLFFKRKRSGIIDKFTMDVDLGYKYIEKFRSGVQWCVTEAKDFISGISFKLKIENNKLVSINGQSIAFTSIYQRNISSSSIFFLYMPKNLIKLRYNPNFIIKSKTEKLKVDSSTTLPTNLQNFKQKFVSGNGFFVYR